MTSEKIWEKIPRYEQMKGRIDAMIAQDREKRRKFLSRKDSGKYSSDEGSDQMKASKNMDDTPSNKSNDKQNALSEEKEEVNELEPIEEENEEIEKKEYDLNLYKIFLDDEKEMITEADINRRRKEILPKE